MATPSKTQVIESTLCGLHEYTGLWVSENGDVFNTRRRSGELYKLPFAVDKTTGYPKITWYNAETKKSRPFTVHQLVAEVWVDNPLGLKYIDHIDRNKLNPKASNLRYVSQHTNNLNTERSDRHFEEYGFHSWENRRRYKTEWAKKHYIKKSK